MNRLSKATELQPWIVLAEEEIFAAPPWIQVLRQQVALPDGRIIDDYHFIDVGEHVATCATTDAGKILFVHHYRHGAGKVCLGLPAGAIKPGEEPLLAAQRELLEETGFAATEWAYLGTYVEHGNYRCGKAHLFKATRLQQVAPPDSGDLEEMRVEELTPTEMMEAVASGNIPLLGTLATILLATQPGFIYKG